MIASGTSRRGSVSSRAPHAVHHLQQHNHVLAAKLLAEEFGVASEAQSAVVYHGLLHGCRDDCVKPLVFVIEPMSLNLYDVAGVRHIEPTRLY